MEEILKELDKPLHSVNINYYFQYNMAWMVEYSKRHNYELKDVVTYFVDLYPTIKEVLKSQNLSGFLLKHNHIDEYLLATEETEDVIALKQNNAIRDVGDSAYAIVADIEKTEETLKNKTALDAKNKEEIIQSLVVCLKEKASMLSKLPSISIKDLNTIFGSRRRKIYEALEKAERLNIVEKTDTEGTYKILDKDELLHMLWLEIERNKKFYGSFVEANK